MQYPEADGVQTQAGGEGGALDLDSRFAPTGTVEFTAVDGDVVIVDLGQEKFFGLNEVGAVAWQRLVEGRSPRELLAELEQEYDVAPAVLEADATRLIELFIGRGWMQARPATAAAS